MEKKKLFLFICLFWFLILIGFIAVREFTLKTGEEILLKTQPVDPRDLFRGDYVTLTYEISTLDLEFMQKDAAEFRHGDNVYVLLDKAGNYSTASGIYITRPKEGLFLKGKIKSVQGSRLTVEYGIESYFVPEGKGREIERQRGNLDVKVSVDRLGNAVIKALIIDGNEIRFG